MNPGLEVTLDPREFFRHQLSRTPGSFQEVLDRLLDEFYEQIKQEGEEKDTYIIDRDAEALDLSSRLIKFRYNLHYHSQRKGWHFRNPDCTDPGYFKKIMHTRDVPSSDLSCGAIGIMCALDKGGSLLEEWEDEVQPGQAQTATGLHWLIRYCGSRQLFRAGVLMSVVQDPVKTFEIMMDQECSGGRNLLAWTITKLTLDRGAYAQKLVFSITHDLLSMGANPNQLTTAGTSGPEVSPLIIAAGAKCTTDYFKMLVMHGARIEDRMSTGLDALAVAVSQGSLSLVRFIMNDMNFCPAERDYGTTGNLFGFAAISGNPDLIKFLSGKGIDPKKPSKTGLTPLLIAARLGFGDSFIEGILLAGGYHEIIDVNIDQLLPKVDYPLSRAMIDRWDTEARNRIELAASRKDPDSREISLSDQEEVSVDLEISGRFLE